MTRHFVLRLLLSVLAIVSMLPLFLPDLYSGLPLAVQVRPGVGYVISAVPEVPLPEGIEAGDVLDLDQMTPEARMAALVVNNLAAGPSYPIAVRRDGETRVLQVHSVAIALPTSARWSALPVALGILALALITLWRGRDWAAWGLMLFSLSLCIKQIDGWPVDAVTGFVTAMLSRLIVSLIAVPGLYFGMETLVGPGLSARLKRRLRIAFAVTLALAIALSFSKTLGIVFAAWTGWMVWPRLFNLLSNVVLLLPMLPLLVGYRSSNGAQRIRIRWVLWSTAVLGLSALPYVFLSPADIYWFAALNLIQGLSFFGYLYAVLRHRLVDVSFVVDRTLVYGLTTGMVVGVFAALEQVVEQLALGNNASLLLQAAVTLIVAILLNRVHRRVEALVDGLLFRAQHRSIELLRNFTRQCGAVENVDRLLPLAINRIVAAIGEAGVVIYERSESAYVVKAAGGRARFPATVEVDDPVFLALRSGQSAVDIAAQSGEASALGRDGWAFPISRQGQLTGCLVCLPPASVQFAPDQREALGQLAQELGIAQYLLRARLYADFVEAVAADEVTAPAEQARRLLDQQPVGA